MQRRDGRSLPAWAARRQTWHAPTTTRTCEDWEHLPDAGNWWKGWAVLDWMNRNDHVGRIIWCDQHFHEPARAGGSDVNADVVRTRFGLRLDERVHTFSYDTVHRSVGLAGGPDRTARAPSVKPRPTRWHRREDWQGASPASRLSVPHGLATRALPRTNKEVGNALLTLCRSIPTVNRCPTFQMLPEKAGQRSRSTCAPSGRVPA